MLKKWFHKHANRHGYFQLSQLKVGGMCGCCGEKIPNLIWVDYDDNWDDIGTCEKCLAEGDQVLKVSGGYISTQKKRDCFMTEMGKAMFKVNKSR